MILEFMITMSPTKVELLGLTLVGLLVDVGFDVLEGVPIRPYIDGGM